MLNNHDQIVEKGLMTTQVKSKEDLPVLDYRGLLVSLKPSRRKSIKKTKVLLEGSLTINNVKPFLEFIPDVFTNYDYVDFYLQNIDSLDLSFIQSLYHLKEVKAQSQKVVTIDAQLSDDLKKIITQSGFDKLIFKIKNV